MRIQRVGVTDEDQAVADAAGRHADAVLLPHAARRDELALSATRHAAADPLLQPAPAFEFDQRLSW